MPMNRKKLLLLVCVLAGAGLFLLLAPREYFTLAWLAAQRQALHEAYAARPLMFIAAYSGIYLLMVTLSLPGAGLMSLAGGAIFGLWVGVVLLSFLSSIGATLACAMSRYLLRDWVRAKMPERLAKVDAGVAAEGAFYLFAMRLIPAVPFFAINLAMGLTKMRLWTFYRVSQLGMLPGTIVFINAGKELGKIESLAGIMSPGLIVSFVLLGLLPLAAKKLVDFLRARRAKRPLPPTQP